MPNQDLINKFEIYQLVKNYFCLTKESLLLFKHKLFYTDINSMYEKKLGNLENLRKKIPINLNLLSNFDEGWKTFQYYFPSFAFSTKITYKQFNENKVIYKKQEFKIKKALVDHYKNNIFHAMIDFHFQSYITNLLKPTNLKTQESYGFRIEVKNDRLDLIIAGSGFSMKKVLSEILYEDLFKNKEIIKILEGAIIKMLETIGTRKLPNKKLFIVFSLNFADWFLCSTAENWSSCLNLESEYEEAFWTGLPGLIADKNRAMIYITDGTKKEYGKIKVDKILTRSWILTIREKNTNEKFFHFVREYPLSYNLKEIAQQYFNIEFASCSNFVGKHYIELIYHNVNESENYLSYIYQDTTSVRIAKKNKAKYFPNKYGYLKSGSIGHSEITINKETNEHYYNSGFGFKYCEGLYSLCKDDLKNYFCDFSEEE